MQLDRFYLNKMISIPYLMPLKKLIIMNILSHNI